MIIFVRHGETELNAGGRLQGRVDRPLNERGYQQAAQVAGALATSGAVRVVSSPLVRAAETARVIADACGLSVETDERLIEVDYGAWDAISLAEARELGGAAWYDDPDFAPPNGESLRAVADRAAAFVADVTTADPESITIAVSHVGPIKGAITDTLGLSPLYAWRMHLDVASISRVAYRDGRGVLRSFNETAHLVAQLPPDLHR